MNGRFLIKGGRALNGDVSVWGSKNSATKLLAACLLTKEPCYIENVPKIADVFTMIDILRGLGADIEWNNERSLHVVCANINPEKLNRELVGHLRSSVVLLGPLFARFHEVKSPYPGGDRIGARPIKTHLDVFRALGAEILEESDGVTIKRDSVVSGSKVVLRELSVTATENALMAASLVTHETKIYIAAAEPSIHDLIAFLRSMGVDISGDGTHTLVVRGKEKLGGGRLAVSPDYLDAATFTIAAIATKGHVKIHGSNPDHLLLVFEKLKEMGADIRLNKDVIEIVPVSAPLRAVNIQAMVYPGIPTDLQSIFGVLATQMVGTTLIHDPLFEGRFRYIEELNRMGANAFVIDPHRALINGPTALTGIPISSLDIRSGAALVIAGLVANGETLINDVYQIDRGYEAIDQRLKILGADIIRLSE
ncbi:MAG: UDP-N-acetylglucosamine 1-carboxyvinyltransferase [Candidatus Terrybacteria bacterium RIFCSPLOWO2_01_FULL_44_24]|uniref:UDP-N-acetylglucosamine 1-carboxyvinyltransferase n=1 Tax=Candidatus Terrybacteria bacterium RIFCSPHIGHO2_01_FULL_43_35 TaxID=1802361 RepID=A0A1G2PHL0_9BACT|nr:MAG: UDP-N-acetylglucosamine 1-carboxyvinyltransferase [Candidatus Terrybacteria bacterium RIFCSPHIGHO2_01_FULL_43_35]OHA49941.1 MAG: UDP-N-acetylglucosamine 1-carboxyvinyltransferase [Candidatus Terrybacteria bacterium RIFCSPHIGHO2_02_FULL_43_14]OHA51737.1 MAG: UDP-N-acetylglucosamine 1-carboxyvinyltransferase [Candidatus Terrybacteria bacterium RIFCSPLOWO2_01_FULL_44_24]